MEIQNATLRDLGALRRLEQACFGKDAWPLLDLMAVLTWPDVIKLKVVENGEMIAFAACDPRPSEHASWIATLGVDPRCGGTTPRGRPVRDLGGHRPRRTQIQSCLSS